MVSINALTHPISKTGFTLIIIRLGDLKVSVVRNESINIWLRAKDVSPWTTFYFLPVYFTLFERRLKCVKKGEVYCLKVWSAKENSCRLQNCAFSPESLTISHIDFRFQQRSKWRCVAMRRYTAGRPVNTVNGRQLQFIQRGSGHHPLLGLPMQSISGLLGKSGDGVNSHWDSSRCKNKGGEHPLKATGVMLT